MAPKKRATRKSRPLVGAAAAAAAANGGSGGVINYNDSKQSMDNMKRPVASPIDFSVPPKKRKTGLTAAELMGSNNSSGMMQELLGCRIKIPVPEWLKVSIQLMLLNFHPEGVALLNIVESEFEGMYRNVKVNPEVYGFEDWEEMLKSSQFKKHFFMYTEKKMMYVKGLPLSRSGTINLRNNVWEIDPKVEAIEMPLIFQEPGVLYKAREQTISGGITSRTSVDLGTNTETCEEPKVHHANSEANPAKNSASAVLSPAPPKTPGRKPKVYNSEYRLDPDFLSSTRVKPSVMSKLAPEMVDKSDEDEDNSEESQNLEGSSGERNSCVVPCSTVSNNVSEKDDAPDAPNKNGNQDIRLNVLPNEERLVTLPGESEVQTEGEHIVSVIEVKKIPVHVEIREDKEIQEIRLDDGFFRRSDVPEDWTKSRFDDDDKFGGYRLSDVSVDDDGSENELVIDETRHNQSGGANELEMNNRALMNSPSPPPPKLHRMDIILSALDSPKPKEEENSETKAKPNRADLDLPEISRTVSVIRTLSEDSKNGIETPTSGTSTLNSPTDSEVGDKDKKWKQCLGSLDPGVSFFPWTFQPLHIDNTKIRMMRDNKLTRNSDNKVDSTRDPRLTVGIRSKQLVQEEKRERVQNLSDERTATFTDPDLKQAYDSQGETTNIVLLPCKRNDKLIPDESKPEDYSKEDDFEALDHNSQGQFSQTETEDIVPNIQRVIRESLASPSKLFTENGHLHYQSEEDSLNSYKTSPEKLTVTIRCHPEDNLAKLSPETQSTSYIQTNHQNSAREDYNSSEFPVSFNKREMDVDMTHSSKDISMFQRSRNSMIPKLRNPIPDDGVHPKSMTFEGLLKDAGWKTRLPPEKDTSKSFFSPKVLERWKETKRKELTPPLLSRLVAELQTYENKPYPSRCEYFCRSSLRMVEVDYLTNSQFSDPTTTDGCNFVQPDEILYYADFAGAPGGVAEFYSKKRPLGSKGFGITYKSKSYDLNSIPEVIPQYFEAFYGKLNSNNGDGSLFSAETVDLFINRVLDATKGRGVHIVTTIGNLSRVFEENNDKIWKYQHLAQIFVGLQVLRKDGNMVFKMHDIKSAFSAALLYFLYKCFNQVEIAKLDIFAPTSDERAIICLGRRSKDDISGIMRFLGECHKVMKEWYQKNKMNDKNQDSIGELIPLQVLEERTEFMDYLRISNDRLKVRQTEDLIVIVRNLKSHKSIFTRAMYRRLVANTIERWKVGLRPLFVPSAIKTPSVAYRDLKVYPEDICEGVETLLNEYNLYSIFSKADPWKFVPIGKLVKTRGFYLGVDNIPHFFDQKYKEWIPVREFRFSLPSQTLVYAQIVPIHDYDDDGSTECVFAIIDALYLAGKDIRNLPYHQRMLESSYFCAAVTRIFYPRWLRLTVTEAKSFSELPSFLSGIKDTCKFGIENLRKLSLTAASVFPQFVSSSKCFHPSGVLFFETSNGNSFLDFSATLFSRVSWKWVEDMDLPLIVQQNPSNPEMSMLSSFSGQAIGSVSAKKLIEFVNRYS